MVRTVAPMERQQPVPLLFPGCHIRPSVVVAAQAAGAPQLAAREHAAVVPAGMGRQLSLVVPRPPKADIPAGQSMATRPGNTMAPAVVAGRKTDIVRRREEMVAPVIHPLFPECLKCMPMVAVVVRPAMAALGMDMAMDIKKERQPSLARTALAAAEAAVSKAWVARLEVTADAAR